jgi:hypothetical protein
VDYDADGRADIVTGSYTGQLYLFRRQADGSFAAREELVDETKETLMMPKYSVVPELVDMDKDGDLDLVVGARSDPVLIVTNVGTRSAPVWSKAFRELKTAGGETIQGSNVHHADWDGDGIRDIVVGSEHGQILWYKNRGANDAPSYGQPSVLVGHHNSQHAEEGSTPERPGLRVKVHVTDWNGDGRVDLLVGDVTWQQSAPKPLTAAQTDAKAALEKARDALLEKVAQVPAGPERDKLQASVDEHRNKLRAYDRPRLHTHGWVWLYQRRGAPGNGAR